MPHETILFMAKEVRGKTLQLLKDVPEAQARFAPPGLNNSILWHAGHCLMVTETLGLAPALGRPPAYPADWFEKFSWTSKPATVKEWPTLAEVSAKLAEQSGQLTAAISALTADQLTQVIGNPAKGRTLSKSILYAILDEANHQGEMWLLKKMQTKGT